MTDFDAHREHLMRNPRLVVEVEDRTDPADPVRGEVYGYTSCDVSVCWSRIPRDHHCGDRGVHCVYHSDVKLDDPNYVLIGED